MIESVSASPLRKPRADGLRNRQKLLDAAKAAFADANGEVSLEEIARRAGVGIGTLYRHFPTRDVMVEAVYRNEVQHLAESVERLVADLPPIEALRAWLHQCLDYVATKRLMAPALASLVGGPTELYAASGVMMTNAITRLVEHGKAAGEIRDDVEPGDVFRGLVGLTYGSADPGWSASARRLIDILIAGLSAPAKPLPARP